MQYETSGTLQRIRSSPVHRRSRPVEPGEAEWNLDTLEALFDYYFVQPSVIRRKKDALKQELKDAGKRRPSNLHAQWRSHSRVRPSGVHRCAAPGGRSRGWIKIRIPYRPACAG